MKQVGANVTTQVPAGVAGQAGVTAAVNAAMVSGAGTAAANGKYTPRGTSTGKPYYNLIGQQDSASVSAIVWDGRWQIIDDGGNELYNNSDQDVAFPWLSAAWVTVIGDAPAPIVRAA